MLGTLLVGLIVAGWAALAVRSLWRNRKNSCGGDCTACGCCTHGCSPNKEGKTDASAE